MSTVDLDRLIASLDPDGRGGLRHVDDVATAIRDLLPHLEPAAIPDLVRDTIQRGEHEGRWSATRSVTVRRGRATLPKAVRLPATRPPGDTLRQIGVPLRPELASWAAAIPLSTPQRQVVIAINEWLRRTDGGQVPIVEAAERAYEILGDEKAFDAVPPRGGARIWAPDRLTLDLLRCRRTPTPLTWEPVVPTVGQAGPIICVENHATFRTLIRILRAQTSPRWIAVGWIQGRNTAPLESLGELPFTVTRLDYLGDLDPAGLAIAAAACAASERAGVPAGPATDLWMLLAERPSRRGPQVDQAEARRLVAWLPDSIHVKAQALLVAGRAVPQEALSFDILASATDNQRRSNNP